jgi:5S rRNA maturation endonuclease (ribonuclease M5)
MVKTLVRKEEKSVIITEGYRDGLSIRKAVYLHVPDIYTSFGDHHLNAFGIK